MATALEMPLTAKIEQRATEVTEADARKREAIHHMDMIKSGYNQAQRGSQRVGWHALQLKEKNLWGMIGARDENEGREICGVGESTWFAMISLAQSFRTLPEELFVNMKQANAKALADMPTSAREDRQWIRWATDESMKDFAKRVDEAMNGKARASDSVEPTRTLKITMPQSRQQAIEGNATKYAEQIGLENPEPGQAIELALAEVTGGASLTEAIVAALQKMAKIKEICESGLSSDEVLSQVIIINEDIVLGLAEALNIAKGD